MSATVAARMSNPHSSPVAHDPDPAALRPLITFAAIALPIGWVLLSLPVVLHLPLEPFVLPVNLLGLHSAFNATGDLVDADHDWIRQVPRAIALPPPRPRVE